jgi:hypothetical protein
VTGRDSTTVSGTPPATATGGVMPQGTETGGTSALDRLERQFQALVLDGTQGFEDEVAGTERVPRAVRLAIYADAYRSRLAEVLENNFPMLARFLGQRQFDELARAYVARYRSRSFSVRWYGDSLEEMLAANDPWRGQPVLAELARWEWTMAHAFDAANADPASAAALSAHAPEAWGELTFAFQASVRLLSMATNAPPIWRALSREESPPPPAVENSARDWLIWRRGLETVFRSLETTEAGAIRVALAGEPFAAVCEAVAAQVGDDAAAIEAARLLATWLRDELISSAR